MPIISLLSIQIALMQTFYVYFFCKYLSKYQNHLNNMNNSKGPKAYQMTQYPVLTQKLSSSSYRKSQGQLSKGKQQQNQVKSVKRFQQPMWIYILIIVFDFYTTYSVLLTALIPNKNIPYAIYIGMTIVRCSFWVYCSWQLIGFCVPMARLYFLLDNILILELSSDITYVALNYNTAQDLGIAVLATYPILLFFGVGNFRVMMVYCDWKPWQVLLYKFSVFQSNLFFLSFGVYVQVTKQLPNQQLYLLFIFSTFGFSLELMGAINALDQSDNMSANLKLKDVECENLIVNRDQDQTVEKTQA